MSDRGPRGRFAPGNRLAVGRAPRRDGLAFASWLRTALAEPARRKKLLDRIDRELSGEGPAPLTVKALAFAYGEPKIVHDVEVTLAARRIAAASGLDVEILIAEATRLQALADEETN